MYSPAGSAQPVLCTRLRLDGGTQTEIVRGWIEHATPGEVAATVADHFAAVDAAMGGFAAALGLERLATRFVMLAGTLVGLAGVLQAAIAAPHSWQHVLRAAWWMVPGFGIALLSRVARVVLRWRLRRRFRRGLVGTAPGRDLHTGFTAPSDQDG